MKHLTLRKVDKFLGAILVSTFRYLSLFLGAILQRKHDITKIKKSITVIKMLGGGSVFIALPSLLAIRKKYPDIKMIFVGQKSSIYYAELTGIFDEYIEIRIDSVIGLIFSSVRALIHIFRTDLTIDLEIHSKMTSLFSLFSCAKNRFGFYVEHSSWQRGILTHALFINDSTPVHIFFQQVACLLNAPIGKPLDVNKYLMQHNKFNPHKPVSNVQAISLGCFSSELCPERELTASQWSKIITAHNYKGLKKIVILGGKADVKKAAVLTQKLQNYNQEFTVVNLAGQLTLHESIQEILQTDKFISIDSGLNHIVRLLNMTIESYWGPTNPKRLLAPGYSFSEKIHYKEIFCSPCVHLIIDAPCQGNNICMQQHTESIDQHIIEKGWIIRIEKAGE